MLRTNLSTRPFYNVRAVHAILGTAALIVFAITLFNVVQIVRLTATEWSLGASASQAEQDARRLRAEATKIRSQINPEELQVVSNAAREANAIIDQRTFSWTDLFAEFEATLPPDVRITAVQPRLDRDGAFVRQKAGEDIRDSTRRKTHHHPDRLGRIAALGECRAGAERHDKQDHQACGPGHQSRDPGEGCTGGMR